MNKGRLLLKGSVLRVLQTFVSIAIGFLMMPFMVEVLGVSLYGIWVLVGSIVASYYFLDLGFAETVTRYVSNYIHKKDYVSANRIISSAIFLYTLLGLVLSLATILISVFIVPNIVDDLKNLELYQILIIITGISVAMDFPSKAFPGVISAYYRFDFIAIMRLGKTVFDALAIWILLSNGFGLIAVAVVGLVSGLASMIAFVTFSLTLDEKLNISIRNCNFNAIKEIFQFSKWVFLIDVCSIVREKYSLWILAAFFDAAILTTYYIAVRISDLAIQFLNQATGITGPLFTESYAKSDFHKMAEQLEMFTFLNLALSSVAILGGCISGYAFVIAWMGTEIDGYTAYLCLLAILPARLLAYTFSPVNSMLLTLKKHNYFAIYLLVELIICGALAVLVGVKYSLLGVAISYAAPLVFMRPAFLLVTIKRSLDVFSMGVMLRFLLLALSLSTIIYFGFSIVEIHPIEIGWLSVLHLCIISVALSLPVFYMSIRPYVVKYLANRGG